MIEKYLQRAFYVGYSELRAFQIFSDLRNGRLIEMRRSASVQFDVVIKGRTKYQQEYQGHQSVYEIPIRLQ